jgi:hypothetical protein
MKGDFCVPYMNSMLLPTQLFLEAKEKKRKKKTLGRCLTLFAKVKKTKKELLGKFFCCSLLGVVCEQRSRK